MMRLRCITWKRLALVFLLLIAILASVKIDILGIQRTCSNRDDLVERKNIRDIPKEQLDALKKSWLTEYKQKLQPVVGDEPPNENSLQAVMPVECLINDNYTVQCLKTSSGDDIYMPFTFLEKYFEVYGKMKHYDGYDRFEFSQTTHKIIFKPNPKYLYNGPFMTFDQYSVETRDRVKCISGIEGVPVCTQWDPKGYFYPIQICQYGMSHYSKHLLETVPPKHIMYENGNSKENRWKSLNSNFIYESLVDQETQTQVIKFSTSDSVPLGNGITFTLGNTVERELSFDIKFISNGSITVVVDSTVRTKPFIIHYVTSSMMMDYDGSASIIYGIGKTRSWRTISRNLLIDLKKGVGKSSTKKTKKRKVGIQKVIKLIVRGTGFIDNITLSTNNHMIHFRDACDWIVANQDPVKGGWKNDVARNLPGFPTLPPGWLSAMAQGQAMSMLSRAYYVYNDMKYVKAMIKALLPFTVPSSKGGFRATFLNKYVWYEEYPTTPSSFVLNGFMFSLIGLYDFKSVLEDKFALSEEMMKSNHMSDEILDAYKLVCELFNDGMVSLKSMLPLFDGGSRTFYDLRHFQLNMQPNVARWDYHTTHLSQLALFASVSDDPVFSKFYKYWLGHMKGEGAKHN